MLKNILSSILNKSRKKVCELSQESTFTVIPKPISHYFFENPELRHTLPTYHFLLGQSNYHTSKVQISFKTIAEATNISEMTAYRHVKKLIEHDLIVSKRMSNIITGYRDANVYILVVPSSIEQKEDNSFIRKMSDSDAELCCNFSTDYSVLREDDEYLNVQTNTNVPPYNNIYNYTIESELSCSESEQLIVSSESRGSENRIIQTTEEELSLICEEVEQDFNLYRESESVEILTERLKRTKSMITNINNQLVHIKDFKKWRKLMSQQDSLKINAENLEREIDSASSEDEYEQVNRQHIAYIANKLRSFLGFDELRKVVKDIVGAVINGRLRNSYKRRPTIYDSLNVGIIAVKNNKWKCYT